MFPNLHRHLVQCPPSLHRYVEQTPGKFVGDTKCEKVRMLHSLREKIFKLLQEFTFRSKIGRNQLAHGITLFKVPLEVCGQGCVTEEAPEE